MAEPFPWILFLKVPLSSFNYLATSPILEKVRFKLGLSIFSARIVYVVGWLGIYWDRTSLIKETSVAELFSERKLAGPS